MRFPARIPILYLILGVLVLVSVAPMYFYATRVVDSNRERLKRDEMLLQTTITRSLRDDISQREASHREMLRKLTASAANTINRPTESPESQALLKEFVESSDDVAYAILLNSASKGINAGRVQPDAFMQKELERAFVAALEGRAYTGQPLTWGSGTQSRTLMLVSAPVLVNGAPGGMAAAFIDLQFLIVRLRTALQNGLYTYVVNSEGRLVAGAKGEYAAGQNMAHFEIVKSFVEQRGRVPLSATTEFTVVDGKKQTHMLGTYAAVPGLNWAVIAQKTQAEAYQNIFEMQQTAFRWAIVAVVISMLISVVAARSITRPIEMLTETSHAIGRGDFSQRVNLKSRTEIGELASTFNLMTESLEKFVADLKHAAEENRALFLSSIQMLAGAVDEKDPYTRGHSDRVTRYSIILAQELGLAPEEVEKVRVAAQLHDVGKIGIEDRVLKKPGALTPEEYELMKAHTSKGANILRPVQQLADVIPGIELHHESVDGRGYPYGLRGEEIPMMAKIIMVADTFDAMTTNRPYQAAMEPEYVVRIINSLKNSKFDPEVVSALTQVFERGDLMGAGLQLPAAAAGAAAN